MIRLPLRRPRLRPRPDPDSGVSEAAHRRALRTQPADSPPAFQAYDRAKRLSGRPSPAAYNNAIGPEGDTKIAMADAPGARRGLFVLAAAVGVLPFRMGLWLGGRTRSCGARCAGAGRDERDGPGARARARRIGIVA
jgi:hypothetical protein